LLLKSRDFLQSKTFLLLTVFFFFILVLAFFFGDRGIFEIIRAQNRIAILQTNIGQLEKERKILQDTVGQLESNPLTLEQKAREKLWLMKKNEKVIVITKKGA
jgi:cell division protein FtsB